MAISKSSRVQPEYICYFEVNKKILGKHKPIFDIYGHLINSQLYATKKEKSQVTKDHNQRN